MDLDKEGSASKRVCDLVTKIREKGFNHFILRGNKRFEYGNAICFANIDNFCKQWFAKPEMLPVITHGDGKISQMRVNIIGVTSHGYDCVFPALLNQSEKRKIRLIIDMGESINPFFRKGRQIRKKAQINGLRRSTVVGTYWPLAWRKSLKSRGRASGKLKKL